MAEENKGGSIHGTTEELLAGKGPGSEISPPWQGPAAPVVLRGPAAAPARGWMDDFEVIREDEHGLFGLLARHIEVPKRTWEQHNARCKEQAELGQSPRRSIFMLPMVPPYTPFAAVWSGFMTLVDLIYTAYWVPLGVAFCTEGFGNLSYKCTSADLLGGCIYTLNMFFGFQFGCIITHDYKKMEVRDGLQVAMYYARYGRFWLDVLAVIPFIYLLIIIGTPSLENDDRRFWIGILSLIRLVRLLRLISVSRVVVMDAMSGKYHDITAKYLSVMQLYTLLLIYLLSVLINLEACIMLLIATLVGLENSFLVSVDWEDFTQVPAPYRWYTAVYWVITTSTTTGYGDFTPRNAPEQVFANIYMMIGMMMFGLMVGTIANALTRASAQAATLHSFRKKLSQVTKWLEDHKIPERTQKQVQTYFTEVWVNRDETSLDSEIFSDLPSYLRAKVAQYVTTDLVLQMHVLRDQESGLQELIAQHLRPVDVTPGHDVCRQGEEGDRLWICAEGDLVALQHQAEPQYLNTPCMFGDSTILADSLPAFRLRPWTVRTMGVVRLWELKLTDLWPIMRMYPQFQEDFLEYVRSMLLTELGFTGAVANQEDTWCESVVSISGALLKQSQAVADQAVLELRQARIEDGSLQELLDGLLEFSAIKTNRATLRTPLQVQQDYMMEAEQQQYQQEYEQAYQQQQQQQQQQQADGVEPEQEAGGTVLPIPEHTCADAAHGISMAADADTGLAAAAAGAGALSTVDAYADASGGMPAAATPVGSTPHLPAPPCPPRRRRSWLHHGGFPPTQHEVSSDEHAADGVSGQQAVDPQDLQLQPPGAPLNPFAQPTSQALVATQSPAPPLHLHPPPHLPPPCVTCGHVPCPTCGHGWAPPAAAAAGLQGAQGGGHRGIHAEPPYPYLASAQGVGGPAWGGPHLPPSLHYSQAAHAGAGGVHALLLPHAQPGVMPGSHGAAGWGPGGGPAAGSTLLPLLGVRGRGTRGGASRGGAGTEQPPQWLPEGRSSMPRGIRTMSLANRPRQAHLGTNSIPVANFGEGYGIWG